MYMAVIKDKDPTEKVDGKSTLPGMGIRRAVFNYANVDWMLTAHVSGDGEEAKVLASAEERKEGWVNTVGYLCDAVCAMTPCELGNLVRGMHAVLMLLQVDNYHRKGLNIENVTLSPVGGDIPEEVKMFVVDRDYAFTNFFHNISFM